MTDQNIKNVANSIAVLSDKHEKDLKKLLRNEYGNNNYDLESYDTLIKSISEKHEIDIGVLETFMNQYTVIVDGKVFIFSRKVVKNKKPKNKTEDLSDFTKITITDEVIQESCAVSGDLVPVSDDGAINTVGATDTTIDLSTVGTAINYNNGGEIVFGVINNSRCYSPVVEDPNEKIYGTYVYPKETITAIERNAPSFGPFGTQWIHAEQVDDEMNAELLKKQETVEKLLSIKCPEQRSPEWFAMRNDKITASDGGCVLGMNDHEPKYKFIIKKVFGSDFKGNKFCYHGKKYENIATMIYQYRLNVTIKDFGLIGHPVHKFLGASPDGIVGLYKSDGKHLTKYVGRMLEIKCPLSRVINTSGDIYDICPIYYWIQVQLQLECCDLDECDFWQCKIDEYSSREEFINDTDPKEPFRSITTGGFEKGCVIQLLPKNRMKDIIEGKYLEVVHDDAICIYPPHVEMTPHDCDSWISETMMEINEDPKYFDYFLDRILYWKLVKSHCLTIYRDRKWFDENLPKLENMWNYVEFFRKNKDKQDILINYINSMKLKMNAKIMKIIDDIYTVPKPGSAFEVKKYDDMIKQLVNDSVENVNKETLRKADLAKTDLKPAGRKFKNTNYAF